MPARLTREAGTADGLIGDGMGLGCLGLQVHRLQGLQSVGLPGAPQKHWRNKLTSRTWGKAMFPWTPPSLLPSPVPDPHPLAGESKASSLPTPSAGREAPAVAAQGWGIPVLPSHPPSFSPFWPRVSFRVWVDPVYCLYLSPPPWPRGPQRGAWTHLSLRGPLSGWGDICKGSRAVEGISQDYDGLEGEGLSHRTHQCPPSAHATSAPVLFIHRDS